MNLSCHFVVPKRWMDEAIYARIRHLIPEEIDGTQLKGLSYRCNVYKYEPEMHFAPHYDGDWPAYAMSEDETKMITLDPAQHGQSKLSLLLYLNDTAEGGNTRLFLSSPGSKAYLDVAP